MSSDIAIRVEGLGKAYSIRHQHNDHVTLAQVALEKAKHPLRRSEREDFWALRDVSFEVKQGEVLGVIGRNGAGKSTLLKLLTRITGPTEGRIDLWGRVGSLLEVGTGFHPELTGRENVYLNGSILGMSRKEINRQFDAIVDFAGVEKFLDTPVKRYSSGMYVRLAFAVAAHLETEILLVDEVLAVGDQEFQRRCLGKMHDVAADGRTVLFVSHQLDSVARLCSAGLLLSEGQALIHADVATAIDRYQAATRQPSGVRLATTGRIVSGDVGVTAVLPCEPVFLPGAPKRIRYSLINQTGETQTVYVAIVIRNDSGVPIAQCDSRLDGAWLSLSGSASGEFSMLHPWLRPGTYSIDFYVCSPGVVLDSLERACEFEVLDRLPYNYSATEDALHFGMVLPAFSFKEGPAVSSGEPDIQRSSAQTRNP